MAEPVSPKDDSPGSGRTIVGVGARLQSWLVANRPELRRDTVIAGVIFLLEAALIILPPSVFLSIDYVYFYKANFAFLCDAVRDGRLPLWNPYIGLGRPFLVDLQNAVFYPPIYLLLLGERIGVVLLIWLHAALAFFGMRTLARALGCGNVPGHMVAAGFLLTGAVVGRLAAGQMLYVCAIAYLPWAFLPALRLEERGHWRAVALLALTLALQFLCGHPQVFWITVLGLALFLARRSLLMPFGEATATERVRGAVAGEGDSPSPALRAPSPPLGERDGVRGSSPSSGQTLWDAARVAVRFGLALMWCLALVGVVLLPFAELAQQGNRAFDSKEFANYFREEWREFYSLFLSLRVNWEKDLFIGLGFLIPGLAGLSRVHDRNIRGLLVVALGGVLVAAGSNTPLFGLLHQLLPGFGSFRIHSRAGLLVVFALLLSAGMWLSRRESARRDATVLGIVTMLVFAAVMPFSARAFASGGAVALWPLAVILLVVIAICVGIAGQCRPALMLTVLAAVQGIELLAHCPPTREFHRFENVTGLRPEFPAGGAAASLLIERGLLAEGRPPPRVCIPPAHASWNDAMIHHYGNFDAYTSLFLKRPWQYLHAVPGIPPEAKKNTYLAPDVYTNAPFPYRDLDIVLGFDPGSSGFVLRSNPSPRAFLVHAASAPRDFPSVLEALRAGHDIHQAALVEAAPPVALSGQTNVVGETVTIRRFEPNQILLDVEAKEPALLVLLEPWYPGWKAQVGGTTVNALPVNAWMRAFSIPGGRHDVRVYYHQNYLQIGAVISLAAWAALVTALISGWLRRTS